MPYVAKNYKNHPNAPQGEWVCAPEAHLGPYKDLPPDDVRRGTTNCGQCVSFVRTVCPGLPIARKWVRGEPVKDNPDIVEGTAIATFKDPETYDGHAAIYVKQGPEGITVYDQWINGSKPQAIKLRIIRWNGSSPSNNGLLFHVVE